MQPEPPGQHPPRIESLLERLLRPAAALVAVATMTLIAWPRADASFKLEPKEIIGELLALAVLLLLYQRTFSWGTRIIAAILAFFWSTALLEGMSSSSASISTGLLLGFMTLACWGYAIVGWDEIRATLTGSRDSDAAFSSRAAGRFLLALMAALFLGGLFAIAKPLTDRPLHVTPLTLVLEAVYVAFAAAALRARNPAMRELFMHAALSMLTVSALHGALGSRPLTYAESNELGAFLIMTGMAAFRMFRKWRAGGFEGRALRTAPRG